MGRASASSLKPQPKEKGVLIHPVRTWEKPVPVPSQEANDCAEWVLQLRINHLASTIPQLPDVLVLVVAATGVVELGDRTLTAARDGGQQGPSVRVRRRCRGSSGGSGGSLLLQVVQQDRLARNLWYWFNYRVHRWTSAI
mmetsp:Transcript_39718/g.112689  ORF Transcript_39718/g.112689 Transcript_39718/m.112689 type:complete len:140 (-) Transcript_39718:1798-2217(-)